MPKYLTKPEFVEAIKVPFGDTDEVVELFTQWCDENLTGIGWEIEDIRRNNRGEGLVLDAHRYDPYEMLYVLSGEWLVRNRHDEIHTFKNDEDFLMHHGASNIPTMETASCLG